MTFETIFVKKKNPLQDFASSIKTFWASAKMVKNLLLVFFSPHGRSRHCPLTCDFPILTSAPCTWVWRCWCGRWSWGWRALWSPSSSRWLSSSPASTPRQGCWTWNTLFLFFIFYLQIMILFSTKLFSVNNLY